MKATFLLFILLISNSWSQKKSDQKSMRDYWADTQTSFDQLLYGEINDKTCASSLKQFTACIETLNAALQISLPNQLHLIEIDRGTELNPSAILPGFIIKSYAADDATLKEKLDDYYKNLEDEYQYWIANRYVMENQSFVQNIKQLEKGIKDPKDKAMIASSIYNVYLGSSLDPHTYIIPKVYNESIIKSSEERKMFGLELKVVKIEDKETIILTGAMKNSPASRAGLERGDLILKLGDKETAKDIYTEISNSDQITIEVEGTKGKRTLTLTRDDVITKNLEISIIKSENNENYAYLLLKSFMDENVCIEIEKASANLIAVQKIKGVILDVRNNTGGLMEISGCLLDLFLEPNSYTIIVKDLNLKGKNSVIAKASSGKAIFNNMHNVVLINGLSASASENTSIFLQAYRKAFIVGERSFGKGTMQSVSSFDKNSKINYAKTIARFYGPHYVSPQLQGVKPDFEIFPEFGQTTPTKFSREADIYKNVIENKFIEAPVSGMREFEIERIQGCLAENNTVKEEYDELDHYQKLVFDQQLTSGKAIIDCAIQLDLPINNSTQIQVSRFSDLND